MLLIMDGGGTLAAHGGEGGLARLFADMLLPLVYLLDEGLGLFLVGKGQTGGTLLEFEGVEEGAVLVVGEIVIDFLVPDYASFGGLSSGISLAKLYGVPRGCVLRARVTYRHIHQFQPKGAADQVVCQDHSPLQAGVDPPLGIWIRHIEPCDRYGEDLVGGFGDIPLDGLLVGVGEDRRHDGEPGDANGRTCRSREVDLNGRVWLSRVLGSHCKVEV